MSVGLKASKRKESAVTSPDNQMIFNSKNIAVSVLSKHIAKEGIDETGSYPLETYTVYHNAGFLPLIFHTYFYKDGESFGIDRGSMFFDKEKIVYSAYLDDWQLIHNFYVTNIDLEKEYNPETLSLTNFEAEDANYGLRCFDKYGREIFSSADKTMSVAKIVTYEKASDPDGVINLVIPHGLGVIPFYRVYYQDLTTDNGMWGVVIDALSKYSTCDKDNIYIYIDQGWYGGDITKFKIVIFKDATNG